MRYAILFSGMSFRRHLNGLEFCYRTLIDRLGFAPENIQVLSYDGSPRAFGEPETDSVRAWPGDATPYRMPVNAQGSREALQHALREVAEKLTLHDQLFINTTGHGGHNGTASGPSLITFPHCQRFRRDEFCAEIAALPHHASLVVLMSQCFSGGFKQALLHASPAESTAVIAASAETRPSFMTFEDGLWDSFQRNWIAAMAGHDVNGARVEIGGDHAHNQPVGVPQISIRQAFDYAIGCQNRNPYDSPELAARPDAASFLTLHETPACQQAVSSLL